MTKDEKIFERLRADYEKVSEKYTVLGVFLQGSQNYGLDYEGSDIDTKAIIVPTFEDIVLNRKPVSTTWILESTEHIDVKDIRLMHECFRKQNINFIEILFTKYRVLNPQFADLYQPLFDNAELIAHYNEIAAVKCILGQMMEKRKALCHPYPTILDRIEKYGYDPKQLHHIMRNHDFLLKYVNGYTYRECLDPALREWLIDIKRLPPLYSLEEAIKLADETMLVAKEIEQKYLGHLEEIGYVPDMLATQLLDLVLTEVIRTSLKSEIA